MAMEDSSLPGFDPPPESPIVAARRDAAFRVAMTLKSVKRDEQHPFGRERGHVVGREWFERLDGEQVTLEDVEAVDGLKRGNFQNEATIWPDPYTILYQWTFDSGD